jgi:signal peptidase I
MRLRSLPRDILPVLLTCATLLCARASLADHYRVPSGSMEPTVAVGDQICVNKLAYGLRVPSSEAYVLRTAVPERGEVVVLDSPVDGKVLLKRVAAIPGDVVAVVDGRLIINETAVPTRAVDRGFVEELGGHPHLVTLVADGGPDLPSIRVPEGRYLVLGDNRGNSLDGRFFGWVNRDAILGRATAICVHDGALVWTPL